MLFDSKFLSVGQKFGWHVFEGLGEKLPFSKLKGSCSFHPQLTSACHPIRPHAAVTDAEGCCSFLASSFFNRKVHQALLFCASKTHLS